MRSLRTAVLPALLGCAGLALAGCAGGSGRADGSGRAGVAVTPRTSSTSPSAHDQAAFLGLERRFHADLGVYALDTGTGRTVTYNADERFAYCSTFKALEAGILLRRDTDAQLDRVITYRAADIVGDSPITPKHVGTGMKLEDLIAAALQYSDNTAANLLLTQIGGPHALQTELRGLGDATTDSGRTEPDLNDATPGDIRDTSTARALGTDLRLFVLGDVLAPDRRQRLTDWLLGNTTGGPYIRAGVPARWKVGDKTGNGYWGTRDDIAIAWPPGRSPVVIAVLSHRATKNADSDDALIADATRTAVAALG